MLKYLFVVLGINVDVDGVNCPKDPLHEIEQNDEPSNNPPEDTPYIKGKGAIISLPIGVLLDSGRVVGTTEGVVVGTEDGLQDN